MLSVQQIAAQYGKNALNRLWFALAQLIDLSKTNRGITLCCCCCCCDRRRGPRFVQGHARLPGVRVAHLRAEPAVGLPELNQRDLHDQSSDRSNDADYPAAAGGDIKKPAHVT